MERATSEPVFETAPNSFKRGGGLQGEDAAGEEAGEDDDGQGADADGVHLGPDIGPVAWLGEEIGDGAAGELGVCLEGGDSIFGIALEVARGIGW